MKKLLSIFPLLIICSCVFANVRLPKIFGDNMVLQRNKPIAIWGWADPNESVTVQFNQQKKSVKADKNGKWVIKLDQEAAGGPYQLNVSGNNSVTYKNVLVGEVWICSGQSNMEMPIAGWGQINNYEEEIKDANYPQIRHIKIPNTVASVPQTDINSGEWKVCSPETAGDFTATGYFFARELYNQLKIPIGLINTSWGGTHVETWTSREAFEHSDEFKTMIAEMPALNLDSLAKMRREAATKKVEALQGSLPGAGETENWKNVEVDVSRWPQMQLPSLWEQQQIGEVDGVVWFRRTVDVSPADAGKEAQLELAMIDDNDITYVNGIKVGSISSWNTPRKYAVPAGVLKTGKNIIAVRVEDTGGGGGIYGESGDMKITIGNEVISLAGIWSFRIESVLDGSSVGPNDYPTLLFNAMVNPLIPYGVRGVIWYQGESNAGRAYQYRKAFPLMITDWRKHWNEGDFPFYFVQLASWNADNGNSAKGSTWAELREAQKMTLSLPNTGMAVTTDIGDANDIHPKNKQDVGKRLAAIALHDVYQKDIIYTGPVYSSMKTEGDKVKIFFTNIGRGLMVKNGELKGFEIAGADKQFYPAVAVIEGDHVVVHSDQVSKPVAVRFGWMDEAGMDNLFNMEGFPAGPFRTDDWKGITEENKFKIGE